MLLRTTLRPRTLRPAACRSIRFATTKPLIRIINGTFYKQYPTAEDSSNPPMFPNLTFTLPSIRVTRIEANRRLWAIVGPSTRTDLLHILGGQHICIPPLARSYPHLHTEEVTDKDPRLRSELYAIQYLGFNGEGSEAIGGTRGAYLSARYESHREATDWTVRQYLRGQTSLNPMEGEENGTIQDEAFLDKVITDLHLKDLLDMPVQNLSNGQTRRARIAKALLGKPELLLLDEPFMGLDPVTTRSISELLHTLVKKSDPRIILALRPQDKVPDWITHVMVVGNDHNIVLQGPKRQIDDTLTVWSQLINKTDENFLRGPLERQRKAIYEKAEADLKAGILDKGLVRDLVAPKNDLKLKRPSAEAGGEPIIEMEGVRVQYGDKVVLGGWKQQVNKKTKEGLHWRVRRGQRWAILGANGSGKTTLLSMITSDHPQTYAQPIKLFGRSRLPENGVPGISIFELQSRIGHSSPEIHAFFPRQLTVRGALESAFAETVLSKPKLNVEIDNRINAMLLHWKPELDPNHASTAVPKISTDHFPQLAKSTNVKEEHYAIDHMVGYADDIKFGELTVAQQRIVLFLRALIAKPDIVILDEAFSGLSASQRDKCMWFLNEGEKPLHRHPERDETPYLLTGLSDQQVLLTISHVPEEIPDIVRHFMRLPSDPGAGVEPLDFRLGKLQSRNAFRFPETWDAAWSPASEFETHANRARRRKKEIEAEDDMYEFKWWAL